VPHPADVTPDTGGANGLPPQVSVQSTPAFGLSFNGTMATAAVLNTGNWLAFTPAGYVTEMDAAFVVAPLPQPDRNARVGIENSSNITSRSAGDQRRKRTDEECVQLSGMIS